MEDEGALLRTDKHRFAHWDLWFNVPGQLLPSQGLWKKNNNSEMEAEAEAGQFNNQYDSKYTVWRQILENFKEAVFK